VEDAAYAAPDHNVRPSGGDQAGAPLPALKAKPHWETMEGVIRHNGRWSIVDATPGCAIASSNDESGPLGTRTAGSAEAQVARADDIAYNNHERDDGCRRALPAGGGARSRVGPLWVSATPTIRGAMWDTRLEACDDDRGHGEDVWTRRDAAPPPTRWARRRCPGRGTPS